MTRRSDISPWNSAPALWLAGATFVLALPVLFTGGYGIFRDELYYVACANHLAFGYVDHPPLSIFILWIWKGIFGDSLFSLRLLATLAGTVSVYLGGRIAALLGGGRFGQILAGLAIILAPQLMALRFYYSMNVFDLLFWNLVTYQFLVLLHTGERRLWVTVGGLIGLTVMNKLSGLWLAAGIGAGTFATSRRRDLLTKWPWIGAGAAILIFSPYVIWEMAHGWPTLEFMHNASTLKNTAVGPFRFLGELIVNMNPIIAPLWILGAILALFRIRFRQVRAVAWIFPVVLLILLFNGSAKPYYLAAAFTVPIGAGAVAVEDWLASVRNAWPYRIAIVGGFLVLGFLTAPLAVPVLPVARFVRYAKAIGIAPSTGENQKLGVLPQFYADMFGWKQLAMSVSQVYQALPEAGSGKVLIFGQNYGEAGAVDYYGKKLGLPPASSVHNSYWFWGAHPADPEVFIIIDDDGADLSNQFEEAKLVAIHSCNLCMPYESHLEIWVCRKPKIDLAEFWKNNRVLI